MGEQSVMDLPPPCPSRTTGGANHNPSAKERRDIPSPICPASAQHQQGHPGFRQHMVGDTAQQQLANPAVAEGTHHHQLDTLLLLVGQQQLLHIPVQAGGVNLQPGVLQHPGGRVEHRRFLLSRHMHQVALKLLEQGTAGRHRQRLAGGLAAVVGQHAAARWAVERPVDHQHRAVQGADYRLQMVADAVLLLLAIFTPYPQHQHPDFVFHVDQRLGQATVALQHGGLGGTGCPCPLAGVVQHLLALLQQYLAAPLLHSGEFLQQFLAGAEADIAAEVLYGAVFPVLDIVEQLEGCPHHPGNPGPIIHHPTAEGGAIDTGEYGLSISVHQCTPSTLSISSGLSCTPKRSTMVALASLRPISSTSAPSLRNLITTLSRAPTAEISQKWAWLRSITTLSSASRKSKLAAKRSAELKNT